MVVFWARSVSWRKQYNWLALYLLHNCCCNHYILLLVQAAFRFKPCMITTYLCAPVDDLKNCLSDLCCQILSMHFPPGTSTIMFFFFNHVVFNICGTVKRTSLLLRTCMFCPAGRTRKIQIKNKNQGFCFKMPHGVLWVTITLMDFIW